MPCPHPKDLSMTKIPPDHDNTNLGKLESVDKDLYCLSYCIAILSSAFLLLGNSGQEASRNVGISRWLFASAMLSSIISRVCSSMIKFYHSGTVTPKLSEAVIIWIPLISLDIALVEFSAGLNYWYLKTDSQLSCQLLAGYSSFLALCCASLSFWILFKKTGRDPPKSSWQFREEQGKRCFGTRVSESHYQSTSPQYIPS